MWQRMTKLITYDPLMGGTQTDRYLLLQCKVLLTL